MKHVATLAAISALLSSVVMPMTPALAKEKDLPVKRPPFTHPQVPESFAQTERDYDSLFASRPAVQRIRVPGNFFLSSPLTAPVPQSILNQKVEIDIRSDVPRLSDLQTLLDMQGIPMTIDWSSLDESKPPSQQVGTFTIASRYQEIANSANSGGGGNSNNNGSNGYSGNSGYSGSSDSSSGSSGSDFGSSNGNGNAGSNSNSGTSNTPKIKVAGAAGIDGEKSPTVDDDKYAVQQPDYKDKPEKVDRAIGPRFYDRVMPFRYFRGTVGELIRRMENSGNLAVWYDNGIVIGDRRRYSVSVLQNVDVVQSMVNELTKLGAKNVVGSVGAGQVFYSAAPKINAEYIDPYLRKVMGNLSEVTLQVAIVTVSMTKSAERGFDWSAFNFALGSINSTGTDTGTTAAPVTGSFGPGQGQFSSGGAFNLNVGSVFGSKPLSIAGAIQFLSKIGDTSVVQNVEMRTLSGAPVILRSGESIPYVKNVGSNVVGGLGSSGITGNTNTATLGTGLTVNLDPRYDYSSGIMTMDVGVKLVDLVEFVQLQAGNQVGTISQPRTREQGVNSIIRVPAGQTAIVGGVRRDLSSETKSAPFGLYGIGSRKRNKEVFWLFAVIRPVVTVYESSDAPYTPKSILDATVTINPRDGNLNLVGNSAPGAVLVGATSTPTDVTVVAPTTGSEVVASPPAPKNAYMRIKSTTDNVPAVAADRPVVEPKPVQAAPATAERAGSPDGIRQTPSVQSIEQRVPAVKPEPRRSFIRPLTDEEKKGNN